MLLGVPDFSVLPLDGALYLQFLLESSNSVSAINCTSYPFKCVHQVAGLESPTLHPTIIAAKKGALRLVSRSASHRKGTARRTGVECCARGIHYDKMRNYLRETATNIAKINSLARKNEHLRMNEIQL